MQLHASGPTRVMVGPNFLKPESRVFLFTRGFRPAGIPARPFHHKAIVQNAAGGNSKRLGGVEEKSYSPPFRLRICVVIQRLNNHQAAPEFWFSNPQKVYIRSHV